MIRSTGGVFVMALRSAVALLIMSVGTAVYGQTMAAPYNASYTLQNLGPVPGLPPGYGGLCFLNNNSLLISADANLATAAIYQIAVVRNGLNQITGFSGTATKYKDAPYIDGGLAFGTGGVLFATTFDNNVIANCNKLLQYKPGSPGLNPDKIIDLTPVGVANSTGTLQFVPAGFPGAGGFRILSYGFPVGVGGGQFYSANLTPDGTGTFNVSGVTLQTTLPAQPGPEGIVYVPAGSAVFNPANSYSLISEYNANRVSVYQLDVNGYPMGASRADFVTGLNGAAGAVLDPLTNDFLFSTFGAPNRVIRVPGFAPPPPGVTVAESGGSTNVAESGATDTYTVVLNTAPTANVTITINPATQVSVAPASLTFTPANWNTAQTATVTAVDDAVVEGAHIGTITHTAASTDAAYNGIAIASVTANITDNDAGSTTPTGPEGAFGSGGNPSGPEGSYAGSGRTRSQTLQGPFVAYPGGRTVLVKLRPGSLPPGTHLTVVNASHRGKTPAAGAAAEEEGGSSLLLTLVSLLGVAAVLLALKKALILWR